MSDERKNLINEEMLGNVAGGQDDVPSYLRKQIVPCPACGKEITLYGDNTGMGVFMTCPHCNKGITFRF